MRHNLYPSLFFPLTGFPGHLSRLKHESRHVGSSPSQKYICLDVQDSIVGVCSIGKGFSEGSAGATLGAIAGFVVVFTVEGVDEDAPSPGSDESFAFFLEGPVESVVSVVADDDPDESVVSVVLVQLIQMNLLCPLLLVQLIHDSGTCCVRCCWSS